MKYRKLRIAWSVGCGVLCLLLIALWVRSYWRLDYYAGQLVTSTVAKPDGTPQTFTWRYFYAVSRQGRFYMYFTPARTTNRIGSTSRYSLPVDEERANMLREDIGFELNDIHTPWLTWYSIASPYWVPLALALGSAFAPWLLWRFSLRSLLIGMTVVAVAVAMIAWAAR